jgi:hypothetical protein
MAEWTWLVYMAGDNNFRNLTRSDLDEMENAGPDNVNVGVHLDLPDRRTARLVLTPNGFERRQIADKNLNSGCPETLTRFIRWGKAEVPTPDEAPKTKGRVVVVWDHGSGWLDDALEYVRTHCGITPTQMKQIFHKRATMFLKNFTALIPTAVAEDGTADDNLTTKDLGDAFKNAVAPNERIEIIGFDACCMGMIEVAHQIRLYGEVMIGSQDSEETEGWPYTEVLEAFHDGLNVRDAARAVVEAYGNVMHGKPNATLSALDLYKIDSLTAALDQLGIWLLQILQHDPTAIVKIARARARAQSFLIFDYVDMNDFMDQLIIWLGDPKITQAAQRVKDKIYDAVIDRTPKPTANLKAYGISVYVPEAEANKEYDNISFTDAAPYWRDFIKEYASMRGSIGGVPSPQPSMPSPQRAREGEVDAASA